MVKEKAIRFARTCVDLEDDLLNRMTRNAKDITRKTFTRHVSPDNRREIETMLGYEIDQRRGLTMANDFHVSYHRSHYGKHPCVYFRWSTYGYIFLLGLKSGIDWSEGLRDGLQED